MPDSTSPTGEPLDRTRVILDRMTTEVSGLCEEDLARYISQHVAVGVAFMRGAMGEDWTRQFLMDVFTSVSNGTDAFVHPSGRRIILPREPNNN